MIISFLGHSSLHKDDGLLERVEKTIIKNINEDSGIVFYCGGYGDFDNLCAMICRRIKVYRKNCEIVFITPYMSVEQQEKTKEWIRTGLYDSVLYPPLEQVPLKFAIIKRNQWMIEQADLIIAYVEHSFGGAYQGLCYARRRKKAIINLAEEDK